MALSWIQGTNARLPIFCRSREPMRGLGFFKANLLEKGSFDTAVQGCELAILLATRMDFAIDAEAQTTVVEAEVKGTLDILKACAKAKSVRRVTYTSSINAASPLNNHGKFGDCVDESCWTPVDLIRRERHFSGCIMWRRHYESKQLFNMHRIIALKW